MEKKAYFYIDDVIWAFRDLTRQKPASLFGTPFMGMLKKAHDMYGMKVQLNVFYRMDFYYGNDEFCLSDMTDAYKAEWEEASDWLKLGFHSKQEFPDYPYVNADYDLVKENLEQIKKEIFRFAGEKSFAKAVVTHWGPISREGCLALRDGGIKIMSVTRGDKNEYNNDPTSLPYGHAQRLLHNRKPETGVYCRNNGDKAIDASICGYNHLTSDKFDPIVYNFKTYYDDRINMHFKKFCNGPCLNLVDYDKLDEAMSAKLNNEYFGYATHEQYFYEDYFAYQPDCENKLYKVAKTLMENGYTHFFAEELV